MKDTNAPAWYENSWLWVGLLLLLYFTWLNWSASPPSTAQRLQGKWVNAAGAAFPPDLDLQTDSPSGGPLVATFGHGAVRMSGRWVVRDSRLRITLDNVPWQYRWMLWSSGWSYPYVFEFQIHELTDRQLILDDGSGPEARDLFRYRRP